MKMARALNRDNDRFMSDHDLRNRAFGTPFSNKETMFSAT
jgi:hypothetical protein